MVKESSRSTPSPFLHVIAGGVGGACGSIVTAPFDVVKTRLQSSFAPVATTSTSNLIDKSTIKFKSVRSSGVKRLVYNFAETGYILRDLYRYEGPSALFRGLGPTLAGVVPGRSINFFCYGNGKRILADRFNSGKENPVIHLSAAAFSGVITAIATNPIWVIKTRLQLQPTAVLSPSPLPPSSSTLSSSSSLGVKLKRLPLASKPVMNANVPAIFSHSFRSISSGATTLTRSLTSYSTAKAIWKLEGTRGFYRGLSASLLGVTEGTIQWGLYEEFKRLARGKDGEEGVWKMSAAAGGAKLVATMITYPHEVVRTRLRQPPSPNCAPRYISLMQTFKLVLLEEGWGSLYGGLTPHLLRVLPNAIVMYFVYEKILRLSAANTVVAEARD